GVCLLGSPLWGPPAFFSHCVEAVTKKCMDLHEKIQELDDSQSELLLLRTCLSAGRITHLLRTTPLDLAPDAFQVFDDTVMEQLEHIISSPLPPLARKQASLPLKLGGLGLRSCQDIALPAFVGSCNLIRGLAMELAHSPTPITLLHEDAAQNSW